MNGTGARIELADVRERRDALIRARKNEEERRIQWAYGQDIHFLEKDIIRAILDKVRLTFSNKISVCFLVPWTKYSGIDYINIEQIKDFFAKAGFDIGVKIDDDGCKLEVKSLDVEKRTSFRLFKDLSVTDAYIDEMNESDNNGKGWLLRVINRYLKYLRTVDGKRATERRIAMQYFDELTDKWYALTRSNENLMKAPKVESGERNVNVEDILPSEYGNFEKVMLILEKMAKKNGFQCYPSLFHHTVANVTYFNGVSMKEQDCIVDEKGNPRTRCIETGKN